MSGSYFPLTHNWAKMEITRELGQQLDLYILLNMYHAKRKGSHRTGLKKYFFFKSSMGVCTVLCMKAVAQYNFICIFYLCLVRKMLQYPIGYCLISSNFFVLSSMSASTKYYLQRSPWCRKSIYGTWSWILQAYCVSQCVSFLVFCYNLSLFSHWTFSKIVWCVAKRKKRSKAAQHLIL